MGTTILLDDAAAKTSLKKPQTTKPALCSQNRSLVHTVNNNLTFQEV